MKINIEKLYVELTPESSEETAKLEDLWNALKKLNVLRNKLAHEFSPKGFESSLDAFLNFIEERFSIQKDSKKIEDRTVLATATLLNFFAPIALNKMKR